MRAQRDITAARNSRVVPPNAADPADTPPSSHLGLCAPDSAVTHREIERSGLAMSRGGNRPHSAGPGQFFDLKGLGKGEKTPRPAPHSAGPAAPPRPGDPGAPAHRRPADRRPLPPPPRGAGGTGSSRGGARDGGGWAGAVAGASLDGSSWVRHRTDRDGEHLGWTNSIPVFSLGGSLGPQANSRFVSGPASSFVLAATREERAAAFTDPVRDKRDGKGKAPTAAYALPDDTFRTRRVPNFGVGERLPWPTSAVPGPGTYRAEASALGRQALSARQTGASCSWAADTMTREQYSLQFTTRQLVDFKKGHRDPGSYRPRESAFGRQHERYATAGSSAFGRSTMPRFEGGELQTITNLSSAAPRATRPRTANTYTPYSWRAPDSGAAGGEPYQGPYGGNHPKRHLRASLRASAGAGFRPAGAPPSVSIPPPSPSPRRGPAPGSPARRGAAPSPVRRVSFARGLTPQRTPVARPPPPARLVFDEEATPAPRAGAGGTPRAAGSLTSSPAFRFGTPEQRVLQNLLSRMG